MRLDGQYDARADIAWLRFEDYDAGAAIDEETAPDLMREFDQPTGRTVGVAVKHARQHLPSEFLKMLQEVQRAPEADSSSQQRDAAPRRSAKRDPAAASKRSGRQSGLGHHRTLKQLHDAWG